MKNFHNVLHDKRDFLPITVYSFFALSIFSRKIAGNLGSCLPSLQENRLQLLEKK